MGSSIMVKPERKYMCLGLHPQKISVRVSFYFFDLCFSFFSVQRAYRTLKQKLAKFQYTEVIN